MGFFASAPPAPTPLGRYRALSKHASIHVSPLVLGAMSIGDAWSAIGFGSMDKDSSYKLLDAFFEAGGNFIDTANNYQNETSEMFIGEWMESRGIRDQMVIATKFSFNYKLASPDIKLKVNYHGNSNKSMHLSLDASLKKLRTSYVDVFYVHVWDYETSIKEVMDNLHSLVVSGKVLYLGISDTPAWVVSQCNQYAIDHGKTPFAVYQGSWNVMDRAFERDILPMAREHGMALCPWNVLASGKLRSDAEEERREKSGEMGRDIKIDDNGWKRTPQEKTMSNALEKVAKEVGVEGSVSAVAIAYLLHKAPYVFPLVGGRKVEHMKENIKALTISLSPEQIQYLESVIPFDVGFPHTITGNGSQPNGMFAMVAETDRVPFQAPIALRK
ncbi:aryl-alcohol dehydrogenase [NADP+] [Favolaschia claudopus]|uniref:Aryl-alcohol dehydrogenase [NADP+] n=1 Tax=Favolaschia claudopus TaxID=2862362 RepID=A0AAW0E6Q3_9AGAR